MPSTKLLLVLLCFALCQLIHSQTQTRKYAAEFQKFMTTHNLHYSSKGEENKRYAIFEKNMDFVLQHNSQADRHKVEVNHLADRTKEEVRATRLGAKPVGPAPKIKSKPLVHKPANLASSFDWRSKGAVTPVKNQGQCSSCWAFASVAAVESAWFLKKGKSLDLSEQNLLSASGSCAGGWPTVALQKIIDEKGINLESAYPYQGQQGQCAYNSRAAAATISSFVTVQSKNESAMMHAILISPVVVLIQAGLPAFLFYKSGVHFDSACSDRLDHAVLLVGYGTDTSTKPPQDYWLIKNSWKTNWGEEGFARMARNRNNNCGILDNGWIPVV